jgi:hypothetical protein
MEPPALHLLGSGGEGHSLLSHSTGFTTDLTLMTSKMTTRCEENNEVGKDKKDDNLRLASLTAQHAFSRVPTRSSMNYTFWRLC